MLWGLNQKWLTKDTNKPTFYFAIQIFYMKKTNTGQGNMEKKELDMGYRNRKTRQRVEPIANRTERKRRVSSW